MTSGAQNMADEGDAATPQICKNCKHFQNVGYDLFPVPFSSAFSRYRCQRRVEFDPIFGTVTDSRDCWNERRSSWFFDKCGPTAKHYQLRETEPATSETQGSK